MSTIVQSYGPIYGEAVDGTVQGRPNGSYYVPSSNVITLTLPEDYRYMRKWSGQIHICNSSGLGTADSGSTTVAIAQDLSSNIMLEIYADSDCTTLIGYNPIAAGLFNVFIKGHLAVADTDLADYEKVYYRAQLMNNGVAIATSDVIEVEVWTA